MAISYRSSWVSAPHNAVRERVRNHRIVFPYRDRRGSGKGNFGIDDDILAGKLAAAVVMNVLRPVMSLFPLKRLRHVGREVEQFLGPYLPVGDERLVCL